VTQNKRNKKKKKRTEGIFFFYIYKQRHILVFGFFFVFFCVCFISCACLIYFLKYLLKHNHWTSNSMRGVPNLCLVYAAKIGFPVILGRVPTYSKEHKLGGVLGFPVKAWGNKDAWAVAKMRTSKKREVSYI